MAPAFNTSPWTRRTVHTLGHSFSVCRNSTALMHPVGTGCILSLHPSWEVHTPKTPGAKTEDDGKHDHHSLTQSACRYKDLAGLWKCTYQCRTLKGRPDRRVYEGHQGTCQVTSGHRCRGEWKRGCSGLMEIPELALMSEDDADFLGQGQRSKKLWEMRQH